MIQETHWRRGIFLIVGSPLFLFLTGLCLLLAVLILGFSQQHPCSESSIDIIRQCLDPLYWIDQWQWTRAVNTILLGDAAFVDPSAGKLYRLVTVVSLVLVCSVFPAFLRYVFKWMTGRTTRSLNKNRLPEKLGASMAIAKSYQINRNKALDFINLCSIRSR